MFHKHGSILVDHLYGSIRIDLEGRVFVEGEQFSVDELEDYLVAVTADDSLQHNASIRADGQCQLSDVVRVIDLCNRVGLSHHLSATSE